MHDCVFKLLRTKDPENLECLCRLLTTIGKELETDKAKVCTIIVFNKDAGHVRLQVPLGQ